MILVPQVNQPEVPVAKSLEVSYQAYAALWQRMERMLTQVRWRNHPIDGGIPRIQEQIAHEKRLRLQLSPFKQAQSINLEAELVEYEKYHIRLWKDFESIIDEICKNKYVLAFISTSYTNPMRDAVFENAVRYDLGRKYAVPTPGEQEVLNRMYPDARSLNDFRDALYARVLP